MKLVFFLVCFLGVSESSLSRSLSESGLCRFRGVFSSSDSVSES